MASEQLMMSISKSSSRDSDGLDETKKRENEEKRLHAKMRITKWKSDKQREVEQKKIEDEEKQVEDQKKLQEEVRKEYYFFVLMSSSFDSLTTLEKKKTNGYSSETRTMENHQNQRRSSIPG
jgi:hypothetical protein